MLTPREAMETKDINECHHGRGRLICTEVLREKHKDAPGFCLMHDNIVEPHATIGLHTHEDDEEIYYILQGAGTMTIDGEEKPVKTGDMVIARIGHSHSLQNGPHPMRLLVIATKV